MLSKLQCKHGMFATSAASIVIAILIITLKDDLFHSRHLDDCMVFGSGVEIFGSLVLIVGALKEKHEFLMIWILITIVYINIVIMPTFIIGTSYFAVDVWFILGKVLLGIFYGFFCCAAYAIYNAYQEMRNNMPPKHTETTTWKI